MALELKHATRAQLIAAFRERYKAAEGLEAGRLARWLLDHLGAGDLADDDVRKAFGLTVGQWQSLKARMKTHGDARNAALTAKGE